MRKQIILIYGGSGLVGSALVEGLRENFEIIAPTHKELELSKLQQIKDHIIKINPQQIIYAAGITKIDEAERNSNTAFLLNSEVPKSICEFIAMKQISFHYLSTNAVFDGAQSKRPYQETDIPSPTSIYGKSKLQGEMFVLSCSPNNSVLRTIMPYATFHPKKKDFARIVLESLQQGKQIEGITDQVINPIYMKTLTKAIRGIIKSRAHGIYHLGAVDWTSNYEFAKKVARVFGYSETLIRSTTLEKFYKGMPGIRTPYYWLDASKFRREFGEGILHTLDEDFRLFQKDFF